MIHGRDDLRVCQLQVMLLVSSWVRIPELLTFHQHLGGGFKYFLYFYPENFGNDPI